MTSEYILMFSLSLNPTKYQTEYWNNELQLLMMHKYFSSQHSPFHNYIHEPPRPSSPFIIYLLYFTLLWPVPRHFSRPADPEHHKAPPLLEPAPVPPVLRAKSSTEGTRSCGWWKNWLWPIEPSENRPCYWGDRMSRGWHVSLHTQPRHRSAKG